ncbi:DUF2628 domain-containing protein [Streptomyces sp. ISL-10]|uniref:hypothetical protein n=1 Tax=Streptomyces sp. ISL-10 TaxID=2819172 RepID=UPI001BE84FA4|nr:hypothetical protein [Streptomyces sp. ISL-10]MBT2369824.1 DUF2628 domain-containing protein [Streptomyces sp. ISL-10]
MNQRKGSEGPCREDLIAYLGALAAGIILVALGVSPTAIITVALGMAVLYEKYGARPYRSSGRALTTHHTAPMRNDDERSPQHNEPAQDEVAAPLDNPRSS